MLSRAFARFAPFTLFAALTFVFALPLSTHPGSRALDLGPDTRLFLWTLGWDVHALLSAPLEIFHANIFYPHANTLAYSEHQIGSALVAAPILAASGGPLLAMNLVVLLACALSGLGAYYLARELGLGRPAAIVCGVVFAFTPPRFFRLGQLHLASVQWIPFCLGLLHRYARGGTTRHLLGAALCFTLQAWSGGQSGLFLALTAAALGLYLVALDEVRPKSRRLVDLSMVLGVAAALNVPFVLPYFEVQRELGLERSLDEAIVWSPNIESFVASPAHVDRLVLRALGLEEHVLREAKAFLFPGLVPLILAVFALGRARDVARAQSRSPLLDLLIIVVFLAAALIESSGGVRIGSVTASSGGRALVLGVILIGVRLVLYRRTPFLRGYRARWKRWAAARTGVHAGFYVWLGALSLWASLGPRSVLYAALYHVLPGFDFIRVPSRLTLITVLAIAVLAGVGAERLARPSTGRRFIVITLVGLVLVELAAFPLETTEYSVRPSAMDRWLGEYGGGHPVAVLPVPDPRDEAASARVHSRAMLGSLAHFAPLVNGYSGFTPQSHRELFRALMSFPDDGGLRRLEALGVRYVVLHRNGYPGERWETLLVALDGFDERLKLVASFEEGRVYELNRAQIGLNRARRGS